MNDDEEYSRMSVVSVYGFDYLRKLFFTYIFYGIRRALRHKRLFGTDAVQLHEKPREPCRAVYHVRDKRPVHRRILAPIRGERAVWHP